MLRLRLLLVLLTAACAVRTPVEPLVAPADQAPSVRSMRAFLIASVAEAEGDLETAERGFVFLTRDDADRAVSHAYLARFLERQRRWAEAWDAWNEALERDPAMWEAHEALASLAGRAEDPETERMHLSRAVELGGSAAVHERLLDVQRKAGDLDGARRTLDRWQSIPLADPIERLHRARAARSLDEHASAVDDLAVVAAGPRATDAAPLLWESARASCRRATAWRWARGADLEDPVQRQVAVEVADAVGDAALLERALLGTPDAPLPADHASWLAPPLTPSVEGPVAPIHSQAADLRRVAEAWRRAGLPERALEVSRRPSAGADPWLWVVRARALVALDRDREALAELARVPAEHAAAPAAAALQLELGAVDPSRLRGRLAEPGFATAFVGAMADAVVRGPRPPALALEAEAAADGWALALPESHLDPWRRARDWRRVHEALAAGDLREARASAQAWTERDPDDAEAWVALALAEPEKADRHLDTALRIDACHPAALVGRARGAKDAEALGWLDRAREADPLSRAVRRALAQRGLEVP